MTSMRRTLRVGINRRFTSSDWKVPVPNANNGEAMQYEERDIKVTQFLENTDRARWFMYQNGTSYVCQCLLVETNKPCYTGAFYGETYQFGSRSRPQLQLEDHLRIVPIITRPCYTAVALSVFTTFRLPILVIFVPQPSYIVYHLQFQTGFPFVQKY